MNEKSFAELLSMSQTKIVATYPELQSIAPSDVQQAYRGKRGCMCGCRGEYHDGGTPAATRVLRELQSVDGDVDIGLDIDGDVYLASGESEAATNVPGKRCKSGKRDDGKVRVVYLTPEASRRILTREIVLEQDAAGEPVDITTRRAQIVRARELRDEATRKIETTSDVTQSESR